MEQLSDKQMEIFKFITEYRNKNNRFPLRREIAENTSLGMTTVWAHMKALKKKGYITWDSSARSMQVLI
jgi:SOS-response transcriptional repressor LexA